MVDVIGAMLRHARVTFGLPLIGAAVALLLSLSNKQMYTSSATFLTAGSDAASSPFSGLAAQFGVTAGGRNAGQSPDFYVALVKSRPVLEDLARSPVLLRTTEGRRTATIAEVFTGVPPHDPVALRSAVDGLRGAVLTRIDRPTSMVHLGFVAESPELAELATARLLELLDRFNRETRRSQATSEKEFARDRMNQAGAELRAAEDALERFLQQNRQFRNSPSLTFQQERLQRQVTMRQEVFTSVAQSYEQARINEVRQMPAITVIDAPDGSARAAATGAVRKALIGAIFGLLLALVIVLYREFSLRLRQRREPGYEELGRQWRRLTGSFGSRLRNASPRKAP